MHTDLRKNAAQKVQMEAPAMLMDFNLSQEVATLATGEDLPRAANIVMNLEKLLIQKKLALDQMTDDEF